MEKMLQYLLNHKKRILKWTLVIALIIVLIVIIPGALFVIVISDGTYNESDPGNTPNAVHKHIQETALNSIADGENIDIKTKGSKSGGYALDVDLDVLTDEIIEDLKKNNGKLNVYFSEGYLHEYLKKMITAEYVTQYPDLRSIDNIGTEVPEGEFQGIVKFIRHKSEGTEQVLEYMPLGPEDSKDSNTFYGLIYQANNGNVKARNRVLNYFSIDVYGNLIIANWGETITKSINGEYETTYVSNDEEADYSEDDRKNLVGATEQIAYTYSIYKVNYKSAISKYTMPFNYLWAFLVTGRDQQFISDFADLVLDSSIEISIYDNLTQIFDEEIEAYNNNTWQATKTSTRTLVDGVLSGEENEGEWSEVTVTKTVHHYGIEYVETYVNTIELAVTYLDIWYMEYRANYVYDVDDSGEGKEITRTPGDPEPALSDLEVTEGTWTTVTSKKEPQYSTGAFGLPVITGYKTTTSQKKVDTGVKDQVNQQTMTTFYRIVQYKYTLDGAPIVIEKTNKDLKEGDIGYPNFCTLYANSKDEKRALEGVESWLFTIIENNADTVNMLELTKYMLYCATGTDFGVTEFNFESLFPTILVSGLYGGSVEEQIWFALLDAGYTKEAAAGALGNFQEESGMIPNNLQNSYESKFGMNDDEYTQAVDNGTYTKFVSDSAGYGIAQWTSSGRKQGLYLYAQSLGVSISDSSMQIEYLLGEISPSGGANGFAQFQMGLVRDGYSYTSWTGASTPEDAAVAFCKVFERAGVEALEKRKASARQLYDKYKGAEKPSESVGTIELTGDDKSKMTAMLNEAVRIANDDRYGYSQAKRTEEFYYDCSSLVYRLYQRFFGISVPTTTAGYSSSSPYNVGHPSSVSLQPGDVLWKKGHVAMYIGNGNYVAAHSSKYPQASQISVYQDNPSKYTYIYRFVGR